MVPGDHGRVGGHVGDPDRDADADGRGLETGEATEPTMEHKLAVIHGDPGSEGEFGIMLDRMQAGSSLCRPEPDREHAGDILVASWQQSGQHESLLDWARIVIGACG